MREPIQARIALVCTLRSPAAQTAQLTGLTEVVARDWVIIRIPAGDTSSSLRPGLALMLSVELPVADGRSPRVLECSATVRDVEREGSTWRTVLDVSGMTFIDPQDLRG